MTERAREARQRAIGHNRPSPRRPARRPWVLRAYRGLRRLTRPLGVQVEQGAWGEWRAFHIGYPGHGADGGDAREACVHLERVLDRIDAHDLRNGVYYPVWLLRLAGVHRG